MNAKIANNQTGCVLYDGECSLCIGWANRFERTLTKRRFTLASSQDRAGVLAAPPTEMRLVFANGQVLGGADALVEIARRIWWASPLWFVAQIPGAMPLLRAAYRRLAVNRNCISGICRVARSNPFVAWFPLVFLPVAVLAVREELAAWMFMWALAFALYAGCKWLTYREAVRQLSKAKPLRAAGYLLGWPGMDAKTFLANNAPTANPPLAEWLLAVGRTLLGALLIWFAVRLVPQNNNLLIGWTGMVGVVFLLHFGTFHLLSLAWRAAGVNAAPLMQNPVQATSLAEFWGKRWNTAFHELVHRFTFRPLVKRIGVRGAMLIVFLLSGLVHELVVSLPAHGGYGLPTGYFLIQGLGVMAEHTTVGRRLGLGRGVRGRLFTMLVTAGPAFWLFHPPFIRHVILPMLHAIGAT